MSVLIDSNVIIAIMIEMDTYHKRSRELFKLFMDNSMGKLYVTDFVLDEVLTFLWVRLKDKNIVEKTYETIIGEKSSFNLIITDQDNISKTWEYWLKYAEYPKRPLSFTDASLLAIAEEYSIQHIASFDDEFNGLISVLN